MPFDTTLSTRLIAGEAAMTPGAAHKEGIALAVRANMPDYGTARRTFWWNAERQMLDGLPQGKGWNMAYEAADRHAEEWRADTVARRHLDQSPRNHRHQLPAAASTYEPLRQLAPVDWLRWEFDRLGPQPTVCRHGSRGNRLRLAPRHDQLRQDHAQATGSGAPACQKGALATYDQRRSNRPPGGRAARDCP